MAFSEIARRYQMQLAAAGSLGLAYWYYRSRLREPSLAEEYNVRNRSGIRPAGSGSDAYLREQQAVASVIKNNSGGGDVDAAWEELHGAVFDAHRHSQFLADTLRQYESDVKVNPSRAREELKEAVEDARVSSGVGRAVSYRR